MVCWVLGVFVVLVIAIVWIGCCTPEGYQDDTGFHYGPEPVPTNSDKPRCDVTGLPITPRQQYEKDCI